jgi:site-specific recombinase XerD
MQHKQTRRNDNSDKPVKCDNDNKFDKHVKCDNDNNLIHDNHDNSIHDNHVNLIHDNLIHDDILSLEQLANETLDIETNFERYFNVEQQIRVRRLIQYQAIVQRKSDKLSDEMNKLNINLTYEIQQFISTCSKSNSQATRTNYERSINMFIDYMSNHDNDILHATTLDADNFITYLRGDNYSANSIHLFVSSLSCLYSYLHRHYDCVNNIFHRCKLPSKLNMKITTIPTNNELRKIINYVKRSDNSKLACLIEIMSLTGLRSGAFTNMTIYRNGKFNTITKGKQFNGQFDKHIMTLIRNSFGSISRETRPFIDINARNIQRLFIYYTKHLHDKCVINYAYSLHDLRHYYAVNTYKRTHDIVSISHQLNHSNIGITGNYLTALNY